MTRYYNNNNNKNNPTKVSLILDTDEIATIIHLMHLGLQTGDPSLVKLDGRIVNRVIHSLSKTAAGDME